MISGHRIQSLAAEGCEGIAAFVMADIDSVLASWATDNFMDGAQEEARISSSDVVTRTHIGDTVKMHFLSYYGNVSMETYTKKPVAKLLGWLAKLYISTTAAKDHLTHCRHYFLEQEWDHMSWQPRKRVSCLPCYRPWGIVLLYWKLM